jgi:hypothetical protein
MPLYIQEGLNLYVGDDGPNNSKHLNLEDVKLPELEELTQSFHPGGAIGQIEVGGMGLKALEMTFKIKGWDPQVMSQFGLSGAAPLFYTVYGVVRDKSGNAPIELKGVARGKLTRVNNDNLKRGDLMGSDFKISELLHYELYFNKAEKFFYDWQASTWRVDGVDQYSDERTILRIPG